MKCVVFVLILALLGVASALPQVPDQPYHIMEVGSPIMEFGHPIAYSPDGRLLAVASHGGLYVYDTRALGEPRLLVEDHMQSVAFSQDGAMLAAGGQHKGMSVIHLWDLQSEDHMELEGRGLSIFCFSPDSQTLAWGNGDSVRFWSITRKEEIGQLLVGSKGAYSLAYRRDGSMLAIGGYNTIFLVDPDGQQILSTIRRRDEIVPELWILCMEFSPDGTMLVAGSGDNAVDVWNVSELRKIETLWHGADVRFVSFTPDGRQLVYGGGSRVIELYDMVTQEVICNKVCRSVVRWESDWAISSGTIRPDGRTLVTGSPEGIISFWAMPVPVTGVQSLSKKPIIWGMLKKGDWRIRKYLP